MLDGQRYFSEFPDEEPDRPGQPARLLLSDELLVTLTAIEREISEFIGKADSPATGAAGCTDSDEAAGDNIFGVVAHSDKVKE